MLIDCDDCAVRGDACGDCVIGVLGLPDDRQARSEVVARFDRAEQHAVEVLAWAGMLPSIPGDPEASAQERAVACLVRQRTEARSRRAWSTVDVSTRRAG